MDLLFVRSQGGPTKHIPKPLVGLMSVHWGLTADYDTLTELSFRKIGNLRALVTAIVPLMLIFKSKTYTGRISFVPERKEGDVFHSATGNYNLKYDNYNVHEMTKKVDENGEEWTVIEGTFWSVVATTVPWIAHDACFAPKSVINDGTNVKPFPVLFSFRQVFTVPSRV